MRQLIGFILVGAFGFGIDGGALYLLVEAADIEPLAARFVSFPLAVLGTWALNRRFVFGAPTETKDYAAGEYGRYFGVQLIGAAMNMLVFAVAIHFFLPLRNNPIIALAIGAAAGLVVNFTGSKLLVFRHRH